MSLDVGVINTRVVTSIFYTYFWLLWSTCTICNADMSNFNCLRSIKDSLEDPFSRLSSWSFNNTDICHFVGIECWNDVETKILSIQLRSMGLKGAFPLGIENCTSLENLDLSDNQFSGPIPSNIGERLPFLTTLDLSFNNFAGKIPVNIAKCSYLNVLKLNNNRLTGQIPLQLALLNRIKVFSVANNLLSGSVPSFGNATVSSESYANNAGLCGRPLKLCKGDSNPRKNERALFVSGFMIGYAIFTILVMVVMLFCLPHLSIEKMKSLMMTKKKIKVKPEAIQGIHMPSAAKERSKERTISALEKLVTKVSLTEFIKATENFSQGNVLGIGRMGMMYRAVLPNGWILAIKKIHDSQHSEQQFISELLTLGRLRHRNLVPLLGFCYEMEERILAYKYMVNGNLHDWLHPIESEPNILEWPLKFKIAVGIARGLAWLHHNSNFQVVHHNISSKCILLDQNFEPKISNFQEAKFVNPNGTASCLSFLVNIGEFWELGSYKKDIYCFGIVLLELVTGEEPNKVVDSAKSFCSSGLYNDIANSLIGQGVEDDEIFQLLKIACNCIQSSPNQRPTMLEVYKTIRDIGQPYGFADVSEIRAQTEIVAATDTDLVIDVGTLE